jgi:predicted nucleic acid-binding protein
MPERKGVLFFDTVTLSNFALAGFLSVLITRYGRRVRVTHEVFDEIMDGIVSGYSALTEVEALIQSGQFSQAGPLTRREREIFRELLRTLAPGEAACIACAKEREGVVVTDDRAARNCCIEQNVRFTGTIGILKACCRDRVLLPEKADAILQAMIEAGYHSPVRRISDLI